MLLNIRGVEYRLQLPLSMDPVKCPSGQITLFGNDDTSCELFWTATSPAGWGLEVVPQFAVQVGPLLLANGAPRVLKSTPDDAVLSLDMTVLLMMFTLNASISEMPAPSQPATLLATMLLVTETSFQSNG